MKNPITFVALFFILVAGTACITGPDRSKPGDPAHNWILGAYEGTASSGWKQCWNFKGVYEGNKVVGTMDRSKEGRSYSVSFTGSVKNGVTAIPLTIGNREAVYRIRQAPDGKGLISLRGSRTTNQLQPVKSC